MTAYSSTQAGNWNSSSTWSPSGVPGDGDTITSITHQVDVTDSRVIGTDPAAGTVELSIGSSGILNITGTLQVKCSVECTQGEFRVGAGGTFEWNVTNAQYLQPNNAWQGSGKVRINGTSGSRATFNRVAGTFYFNLLTGSGYPQDIQASYCDFDQLGDGSNEGMNATLSGTYLDNISFDNCVFTDFYGWDHSTFLHGDADLSLTNCTFKAHASLGGNLFSFNAYNSKNAGGTRTISDCVFSGGSVRIWGCQGGTITGNLFLGGITTINEAVGAEADWSGNFIQHDGSNLAMFQNCTDDVWYIDDTGTNPHAIVSPTGNQGNVTYDGLICLLTQSSTDGNGDFIQIGTPGSGTNTVTVQNCILPPGSADNAMTLITALGDAFVDYYAYHNTAYICSTAAGGDNNSAIVSGETYAGAANSFEAKSNIFFSDVSGATEYTCRDQTGTTSDLAAAAAIDYNCGFNTADSTTLGTNNYSLSSGTHDANSVNVNPNFVGDPTEANLAAWDTANGGAGTEANALTEMAKLNESGFDSNYTIASLRSHITSIFAPTNSSLQNAGHDSADIGAVAYTNPSVTFVNRTLGLS